MSRISIGLLFVIVICAADEPKEAFKLTDDEQAVLDSTNAERKKADVPPLKASPQLFAAARAHSKNMAAQDKLDHTLDDKAFTDRITAAGYPYSHAGENVAWNAQSPKAAVAQWMESELHKANMLNNDYTEIGIGMAKNAKGELYWTQVFAAPR